MSFQKRAACSYSHAKDDWCASVMLNTSDKSVTSTTEENEALQGIYQDLIGQLSELQNEYTDVKVKQDSALSENESHQSQHC